MIDAVSEYYAVLGANAHRGDYALSAEVDRRFEEARAAVAAFLHAADSREIVFTAGSSASLNQIASGYVRPRLKEGDVILSDVADIPATCVAFHAARRGKQARAWNISNWMSMGASRWKMSEGPSMIVCASSSSRRSAMCWARSKAVQTIMAHAQGIEVIVDGAQSAPHLPVDVQQMDCDFFVFSAHKLCGPTGVGVLYGKKRLLDACEPLYLGGGSNARFDACGNLQLKETPFKFESGTPPIEGVLGMKAAIDYLQALGMADIRAHEQQLRADMIAGMKQMDHVILYNEEADSGIVTFNVKNVFAQDAASWFNANGIAAQDGQHCAVDSLSFWARPRRCGPACMSIIRRRRSRVSWKCSGNARWKTA